MSAGAGNWLAENYGHLAVGTMEPVDPAAVPVPPGSLIDTLGMSLTHVGPGAAVGEMVVADVHLNQAAVAQAGAVVALADAVAGWAAKTALREGQSFTTLELNINLLRAARAGDRLIATASPVHVGRSSMVLEVAVHLAGADGTPGKLAAQFRCTEMVLG